MRSRPRGFPSDCRPAGNVTALLLLLWVALASSALPPIAAAEPAWSLLVLPGPPALPAEPPSPRSTFIVIHDPVRQRMLVQGGSNASNLYNDVWALALTDPMQWRRVVPLAGLPGPRRSGHAAVYDALRDRMIVFGGDTGGGLLTNDIWTFSLADPRWVPLAVAPGEAPSARKEACAIYDPVRDRIVIFGGLDQSGPRDDAWTLTLAGTPAWQRVGTPGLRPLARDHAASAFDPAGDRMIVFGGRVIGALTGDAWALEFAAGSFIWRQLTGALPGPSPRMEAAGAFDAARNRFLVSGGFDHAYRSDVWALQFGGTIPEWRLLRSDDANAPPGRGGHGVVLDPARDRMIEFGGFSEATGYRNDVWQLALADPVQWSSVTPVVEAEPGSGPSARFGAVLAPDSGRDLMFLFGGIDDGFGELGNPVRNDLWELTLAGSQWRELAAPGTRPAPRFDAAGAYDPVGRRFIVFGGEPYIGHPFRDVWQYSFDNANEWEDVTPGEAGPQQRTGARMVYDPVGRRMLVFGGSDGLAYRNDVWALSLGPGKPAWLRVFTTGLSPSARRDAAVTFDTVRNRMIVTGGLASAGRMADTWGLDVSQPGQAVWQFLSSGAGGPSPRAGQGAAFDWRRNRLVVFAGSDGLFRNDVWSLPFSGPAIWSELVPTGERPDPRWLHAFALDAKRDRIVTFGGLGVGGELFGATSALVLEADAPLRVGGPGGSRSVVGGPGPVVLDAHIRGEALSVRIDPVAGQRARIVVYSVTGRRRAALDLEDPPSGAQEVKLPADGSWSPGVYFVELTQSAGRQVKKVAVVR